ncbi:cation:proton antiporter [Ruminococcus albus]|uniref:NhaP-type Na+/H+ or K+/H+ antiporter n=1 Tax=Ruminococcus albus TaxID=1264 RepID=A0A1I1QDB4_RUMAL|nr:cation:proton antiporter [Ruminococcus albus]SFD20154.1 NhaP-type Na+/H+ or K+/H+ antiporter [Ruminococcus albus]
MLFSFAVIFLVGLGAGALFQAMKLPRVIGMLAAGIIVSPFALGLLDDKVMSVSAELRQTALIIILIKAGLALELSDLKKVGRAAVLMSFLPACFEMAGYIVFAPLLLGTSRIESALMGAVLSAVSPAVVVPRMVALIEKKRGTEKGVPQMILAGASCDDVFVLVLFSTFLTMAQGGKAELSGLMNIPVSIVLGLVLGGISGYIVFGLFELSFRHVKKIRSSVKLIIMLSAAFMLMTLESSVKPYVAVSGLLAVIAMACIIKKKSKVSDAKKLSEKFGKVWIAAEVILFVMVGAAVDIRYTLSAGASAAGMIFIALVFRTVGVLICTLGTKLNFKERLFCVIAYLPKATVQAAIGSVPLAAGLSCGKTILSVAVLGIILTAPLGAIGIDMSCEKLLSDDRKS